MKIKFPYGTTAENNALTLPIGQLSIDTDRKAIRFHDGVTPGGFEAVGVQAYFLAPGDGWALAGSLNAIPGSGGVRRIVKCSDGSWCIHHTDGARFTTDFVTYTVVTGTIATTYNTSRLRNVNGLVFLVGRNNSSATTAAVRYWSVGNPTAVLSTFAVASSGHLVDIAFFNNLYIVMTKQGKIYTSPDLSTWTAQQTTAYGSYFNLLQVVNGVLYGVGGGAVVSSSDGITWTGTTGTEIQLTDAPVVVYFKGQFIVGSATGNLYTTVNGLSPLLRSPPTVSEQPMVIAASANHVVAAFSDNSIRVSEDGITWTRHTNGPGSGGNVIYDLVADGVTFYGVGVSRSVYKTPG